VARLAPIGANHPDCLKVKRQCLECRVDAWCEGTPRKQLCPNLYNSLVHVQYQFYQCVQGLSQPDLCRTLRLGILRSICPPPPVAVNGLESDHEAQLPSSRNGSQHMADNDVSLSYVPYVSRVFFLLVFWLAAQVPINGQAFTETRQY
jgi:hypothetical protein